MPFPKDFMWGVSTSSAQIEGAYDEDGKCLSIWDCIPEGKVKNNEKPSVACDHYHRYKDDVKILKELGVKVYRFSVSMARIMPFYEEVNQKGLDFYSDLVDELLKNGITPMVTLYHWDLPYWLSEIGGWKSRKVVKYFKIYTKAVVDKLSDRVKYWLTFNEPSCFLFNGYVQGAHAPFIKNPLLINRISRNYFYANAEAVKIIRENAKIEPKVGVSFNISAYIPKDDSPEEIEKARQRTFESLEGIIANSFLVDPMLLKKNPRFYGVYHMSNKVTNEIATKLDFFAINNYSPAVNYLSKGEEAKNIRKDAVGNEINGKGLYWILKFAYERYKLPIFISENGFSSEDKITDGKVHASLRIDYLKEYLSNVEKAIDEGVPVFGYSYWSFMDNFEWAEGYKPRFGLVYVNFETQERTLKDSAYFYKDVIATNGENIKE